MGYAWDDVPDTGVDFETRTDVNLGKQIDLALLRELAFYWCCTGWMLRYGILHPPRPCHLRALGFEMHRRFRSWRGVRTSAKWDIGERHAACRSREQELQEELDQAKAEILQNEGESVRQELKNNFQRPLQ